MSCDESAKIDNFTSSRCRHNVANRELEVCLFPTDRSLTFSLHRHGLNGVKVEAEVSDNPCVRKWPTRVATRLDKYRTLYITLSRESNLSDVDANTSLLVCSVTQHYAS